MPKNCPVCGLVNPDNAHACDCGFSFQYPGTVGRLQLSAAGRRNKLLGVLALISGLAGTLLSVFALDYPRGAVYGVGAMIAGLVLFFKGSAQVARTRKQ